MFNAPQLNGILIVYKGNKNKHSKINFTKMYIFHDASIKTNIVSILSKYNKLNQIGILELRYWKRKIDMAIYARNLEALFTL